MSGVERPRLRVRGGLDAAVSPASLARLDPGALGRYLMGRRWFGAKGRPPDVVRVTDVVPLGAGSWAVTRIEVEVGDRVERYQLPLAALPQPRTGRASRPPLARVESDAGPGVLVDALEDPAFRTWLGGSFGAGAVFAGPTARWRIEPVEEGLARVAGEATRLVSAEQSNTSIVLGDRAILKLFRRLEPGEHPDVEMGRFLTRRRFSHTPALLGVVYFEDAGGSSVAAMVQRFLPGARDAWEHTLEQSRGGFARGAPSDEALADADRLGRVTRELHEVLASEPDDPEFAPRPATAADVARWAAQAQRSVTDALALLATRLKGEAFAGALRDEAAALLDRRTAYLARVERLAEAAGADAGACIRHHGDYHLGQVLRTVDGEYMVIDFEGEPARPLGERRARHSPLRDVAGMVRSYGYAAATLAMAARDGAPPVAVARARAAWEQAMREAFLRGYHARTRTPILPATAAAEEALLGLFELEKAFYELAYEVNHRPGWIGIPVAGITRLAGG